MFSPSFQRLLGRYGTIEAFYNANLALTYQPDPPSASMMKRPHLHAVTLSASYEVLELQSN